LDKAIDLDEQKCYAELKHLNGQVITKEQFDEIEETSTTYQYYMTLSYNTRTSDDNADDTRDKYGMEEQKDLKRRNEKVYFFIFDDLLGTSAFKVRSESKLNNLVTLCRHHNINLLFTTQYLTAIPPTIRNNVRLWVVFKFSNSERLLKHVYPEISNLFRVIRTRNK
jgi:hypothetical protein